MRVLLIWLILTASCFAQLKATGVASWQDTVAGTNHRAMGMGGEPVLCYQDEGEWGFIKDEWVQVGESQIWKSVKGNHRVFADSTGSAIYAVGSHYLGTKTTHLIKFDKSDSTWETLESSDPDSVTVYDNRIRFHNIFPGVHKILNNNAKVIREYSEVFEFTQQARNSLAAWGPWSNRLLGTATKLFIDSLNLSLSDVAGAFDIDATGRLTDEWVKFADGGTAVFYLATSYLSCADSMVLSIPIKKFLVNRNGNYWFVELFDPVAANQLPEGTLWHDATFGHLGEAGVGQDLEDYFRASRSVPASSGTADSMNAYMACGFEGKKVRYALYKYNTTYANLTLIDTVAEFTVAVGGPDWSSKPLLNSQAIVSGAAYALSVWGEDGVSSLDLYRTYTNEAADSTLVVSDEYDAAWDDPKTDAASAGDDYQYSVYCYYTESGGPAAAGQVIIINTIVNLLPWGIAR